MTPHHGRTAVALVALVALLVTGCGGDDSLSAKEFRSRANELCADANKDTEAYGADITEASSDAEVTDAIDRTVERNRQLVEDLDDLKVPDDLADDVDSMLDSVRAGIAQLDRVTSVQDLTSLDTTKGPLREANDKAIALGLRTCGE